MSASDTIRVRRFFERGLYFLNQGQFPDACVNFKDALQLAPNFLPARTHMAIALSRQHKYVDAIKLLEDGRKLVPLRNDQAIEVLRLLGTVCLIRQDYRAAAYYIRAARKLDTQNAQLRLLHAQCACKSGDFCTGLDLMLENANALKEA